MKLFLYILILFFSINLLSWETQFSDDGLCGEHASFKIDNSFFEHWIDSYQTCEPLACYSNQPGSARNNFHLSASEVKYAAQIAANWWNEAGSEHYLHFEDNSNATPIKLIDLLDENISMVVYPAWENWGDICIDGSESEILVNENFWNTNSSSGNTLSDRSGIDFITTLTHEFGHLLGLDHYNGSDGTGNIMKGSSAGELRDIGEDDKYGASYIYGRDDRIIKTTRGYWHISPERLTLMNKYSYEWGSTYETFAKPNIVFQPNSDYGYDYIITWVRSSNKKVYYAFAKDDGDDLVTVEGPFAIAGSQTLSSPSIAINKTGGKAIITYRSEPENGGINSDKNKVAYAEISTFNGSLIKHDYLKDINDVPQYTKSVPIIVWHQRYDSNSSRPGYDNGKFMILWNNRDDSNNTNEKLNWQIKYSITNSNDSIFMNPGFLKVKNINGTEENLYSLWMSMAITCDFTTNALNNKQACMLFFNEIFPDSGYMTYHKLTRVFMTVDPSNTHKVIVDKSKSKYQYYRYSSKYNYGHLGIINVPDTLIPDPWEIVEQFIVTYIPKAALSEFSAFRVKVKPYIPASRVRVLPEGYDTDTAELSVEKKSDKLSRTGYSGVYNHRTNRFRFIWIAE